MFRFLKGGSDRNRRRAVRERQTAHSDNERGREHYPRERDWDEQLWVACKTLDSSPEDVMAAISVSGTLDGAPWEVASLLLLAERFADEFGLRVSADIDGATYTVRFCRMSPADARTGLGRGANHDEQAGGSTQNARG